MAFAAGLVIFISCLTGTVLVFETELEHFFNKKRYYVTESPNAVVQTADSLINRFKTENKDVKIVAIKIYKAANRTVELYFTIKPKIEKQPTAPAKKTAEKKQPQKIAFINPCTAQTIEIIEYSNTFFGKVFWLHRALLANKTGQTITGIATFIFVLILITGMVLWWPKTKIILKQRLFIKKSTSIKRKIFDCHTVLGFYSTIFLLIIACSGLTISFKWFNKMVMSFAGGEPQRQALAHELKKSDSATIVPTIYNAMLTNAFNNNSNTQSIKLHFPKQPGEAFMANAITKKNAHYSEFDVLTINALTSVVEKTQLYKNKKGAPKLKSLILPIHKGEIGGISTRIFAFIISLLGATFPVTGFIMWCNRTQKKKAVK